MRAIIQRRYGAPDDVLELGDVEVPEIRGHEVLVRVIASAVAGDDWHLMRGVPYVARLATGLRRPRNRIPGRDVAGRVEAVGDAVTDLRAGDEVFGWCEGGFAEFVAVSQDALISKPANVTFEEAASLPISGFTALQAVRDKGQITPGQSALVIGASGGVGTLAVQLAKAFGAEVTGVCSAANVGLVQSLGADRVLDYTREDVATGDRRYDVIVDTVGNRRLRDLRRVLDRRGKLVLVGGSGGRWFKGTQRFLGAAILSLFSRQALRPLIHSDRKDDLATLKELVEAGDVKPVVSARYGLDQVGEAIGHFTHGHARGKVVVAVEDSPSRPEGARATSTAAA